MNRFMKTFPENKENLDEVVTSLEAVLLRHHQLDQSKVEKDLARVIFDKALQDPTNAHLYAQLCQRLMESKIDWTTDFIHRLFQLVVDEFNRPLVSKESHPTTIAICYPRNKISCCPVSKPCRKRL